MRTYHVSLLGLLIITVGTGCSLRKKALRPSVPEMAFEDLLIQGGDGGDDENLEAKLNGDLLINGWDSWVNDKRKRVSVFAGRYRGFLEDIRTESGLKRAVKTFAVKNGYTAYGLWDTPAAADSGCSGRYIFSDRASRSLLMVRTGSRPLAEGLRIVAADLDFPRMVVKHNPGFGRDGFSLFQTAYSGYPRKHQWLSVPLGIRGEVTGRDGSVRRVEVGGDDLALVIPDLLPHLSRSAQRYMLITVEDLDVMMDHTPLAPRDGERLAGTLYRQLENRYGLTREEIRSARLEMVPLHPVCEIGVDRGMLGSAGQSAVLPVFIALEALNTIDDPEYTTAALFTSGKDGGEDFASYHPVLGAAVASLLAAGNPAGAADAAVRGVLKNARAVYTGVEAAVNPVFKDGWGDIGYGPVMVTAGEDPSFLYDVLTLFRSEQILWQFLAKEYRGGRVDLQLEQEGVPCLNLLCPLLSRGSGMEIVSKMDLYLSYLALRTFCEGNLN